MLHVDRLQLTLGTFRLRDVTLRVPRNAYLCLVGPTGSGKSALLECLAGLRRPSAGTIRCDGRDITAALPEERGLGYMPQDYALFPHLDVANNIAYGLAERGWGRAAMQEKVGPVAAALGVAPLLGRRPSTLSGGEAQRVALARALVLDCHVLLLDEPFGAVDSSTKRELVAHLRAVTAHFGLTVVHVTHDFSEATALATHVGVIRDGRLLQFGTLEEVFRAPRSRTVASFLGAPNLVRAGDGARPVLAHLQRHGAGFTAGQCLYLPPDSIRLHPANGSLPPDRLSGALTQSHWRGAAIEVEVDVGAPLTVYLSRHEREALHTADGGEVWVEVPPEVVVVVADE
jgi:ABC-type Fe3+/spermidine/putrescine transport system ATPase subunit